MSLSLTPSFRSAFPPVANVIQQIEPLRWFIATQATSVKSLLPCLQQVVCDLTNNKCWLFFISHAPSKYHNVTRLNLKTNGSKLRVFINPWPSVVTLAYWKHHLESHKEDVANAGWIFSSPRRQKSIKFALRSRRIDAWVLLSVYFSSCVVLFASVCKWFTLAVTTVTKKEPEL